MERKSRYAYGYSKKDGRLLVKEDVVKEALTNKPKPATHMGNQN